MEEIWKETSISGYFISNLGRLKGRSGKIVRLTISKTGYYVYALYPEGRHGKCKCVKIHRLVAEAFIPNTENKPFINHIDGNKLNNNVNNLEWCTNQENIIHAVRTGLLVQPKGEDAGQAKLTNEQANWIREHYIPKSKEFGTRALGKKFGVDHVAIVRIINNRTYKSEK